MSLEKEFLEYPESLELKELGFNEPCFGYFINESKELILASEKDINYLTGTSGKTFISAPTLSQAFRWFRDIYGYDIHIKGTNFRASYVIGIPKEINIKSKDEHPLVISWDYIIDETGKIKSYGEAELSCLRKLIEIVKDGK